MKHIESFFEHFLFTSRWLLAPIYLALVIALGVLLVKAAKVLWILTTGALTASEDDIIIGVLSLVDISLIMNLLIIIIFSGYETFVSKMEDLHGHADRPDWMGHIGFSDLKLKLIGSIVAISGIDLLKSFMALGTSYAPTTEEMAWMVGIHLTFVLSGVLYALTDRLSHSVKSGNHPR
ncbi:TIGR00645 family protein [Thiothrix subterranea]|uniref:TIGR00645 family protein n=1 Tax=Thiothrix subterranea TaxID=2735563 RepID=UPI00192B08C3|nr:TIGR00645 family protein [Thiothrix subterranea]QQZ30744.1 TIGR00645 family protein [Thiothrix subterranea]